MHDIYGTSITTSVRGSLTQVSYILGHLYAINSLFNPAWWTNKTCVTVSSKNVEKKSWFWIKSQEFTTMNLMKCAYLCKNQVLIQFPFEKNHLTLWTNFIKDGSRTKDCSACPLCPHRYKGPTSLMMWNEVAYEHSLSASMVRNRLIGLIMKIILPVCFITLKFTGSFIDFMLGFANSNVQEDIDIDTSQVRYSRAWIMALIASS